MNDAIKHECGLAFIQAPQTIQLSATTQFSIIWVKQAVPSYEQHNRGQDGAGIACSCKTILNWLSILCIAAG
jgi:hypothetical protein